MKKNDSTSNDTSAGNDASAPRSSSSSEKLGKEQAPSDSSAGYRDRPAEDGKHGDADAVQAENLSNSNSLPDDRR